MLQTQQAKMITLELSTGHKLRGWDVKQDKVHSLIDELETLINWVRSKYPEYGEELLEMGEIINLIQSYEDKFTSCGFVFVTECDDE